MSTDTELTHQLRSGMYFEAADRFDALRAKLAALNGQEPVEIQARIGTGDWRRVQPTKDHPTASKRAAYLQAVGPYEVRKLYAAPAPTAQPVQAAPEAELIPGEAYRRDGWCCGRCGCRDLMIDAELVAAPVSAEDARDAQRYREVRRGQHWSITDGIGDVLRAEILDAAVDAALAAKGEKT